MRIKNIELINFRSIENTKIDFEAYYTAICGQNNSGKSNIIRALLNILSRAPYQERLNYKSDYPVWKNIAGEDIELTVELFLSKDADYGLIKFLNYFGKDEKEKDSEKIPVVDTELKIKITLCSEPRKSRTEILINNKVVEDKYGIGEILRRIHTSQTIIFHNSTQIDRRFRRSEHGYVDCIEEKAKGNIETKIKTINKELSKVIQKHKAELQSLIGRLQEKYEVGLSISGLDLNLEQVPYEIYLGDKNYELPLDEWGSGTKNRTLILSSIFNAKNQMNVEDDSNKITPIVIIEEPESFLHPSAQAEFGRILQDLSQELEIQVITTTHSPYLLSHHNPKSNILVKRKEKRKKLRETFIEQVDDENWREPFELALGMIGPEFEALKNAFFSNQNKLLLVEGAIDKQYFELLQNEEHGSKKLDFTGEIFAYDGFGFLTNNILLKFIKNRFNNVIITLDLDTYDKVKNNIERIGFEKDKTYFIVGKDQAGQRNVEGLLPKNIMTEVHNEHADLVQALLSDDKDEVKSAKSSLKSYYLDKFKEKATPTDEYYGEFYKLVSKINKSMNNAT